MLSSRAPLPRYLLQAILFVSLFAAAISPREARAQTPAHTITWDAHSLILDGRRVLLYSGEFHYFRLPSRSQWLDRLEKMKAAGLNAVSLYFDWQYHSWKPGQYDFTGVRDVDYLLQLTERLGLYVIARVGPYMNAEIDAGGLPGWILTKQLFLRSQSWDGTTAKPAYSPLYAQYSREWYDQLLPIIARHQFTRGGSVVLLSIENEYNQDTGSEQYMEDLYHDARDDGIEVPIFHNDFYMKGDWKSLVDLYAYDSYPYGFECCHQWWDEHFHGIDTWDDTLRNRLGVTTPMFVSELQGGAFDHWGGPGYAAIARTLGADWLNALDQSALAQGTSILNTYMFSGGTTWGYMSEPGVYTSYDYGAPIAESGALRPAYYAAHRIGLFLQAFGPALAGASAAPTLATASNPSVAVHARVDPSSGQEFIFLRHGDAGPAAQTRLQLTVSGRQFSVPQKAGTAITVPGHGAELLTANVDTGPLHLNYSTSQVLTELQTDSGPYLVLYGPAGSRGEADFALPAGDVEVEHNPDVRVTRLDGELRLNYQHTAQPRTVAIRTGGSVLRILVTSTAAASRYWAVDHMLIAGPDLVTDVDGSVKLSSGPTRDVRLYGAPPDRIVRIDGRVASAPDPTFGATLLGSLAGAPAFGLPQLKVWKFAPEGFEVDPAFDDSGWTVADHSGTTNPNAPGSTLLADDYGFHYGFVWYRGHFTASGNETGIALAARQSYSVYLNGDYLGSANESLADPPHQYAQSRTFSFPPGSLKPGGDNVVAVLTENMGHDEGWLAGPVAQSPQGIIQASLVGATTPVSWRIQGDVGGEDPPDTVRGIQNASGLYGERNGWYLPRFDDSSWSSVTLPDSWSKRAFTGTLGWYRIHFRLDIPSGVDVPIGLTLPHVGDRATIWLNGWLVGRYSEEQGPQHDFYLPNGILDANGENVLAIAVWRQAGAGGLTATPRLFQYPSLQEHGLDSGGTAAADGGYWHTDGNRIVDSAGRPVRIAAVNWAGMQTDALVPAGLNRQPLDSIVGRVAELGFNTIRLPFSNELIERNPVETAGLDANPNLRGLHALDLLDHVVAAAGRAGLRVILDDHRSTYGTDPQENGLWYTRGYSEASWIADWKMLAARYQGNPTVVGVDLRDEPHTGPPGPWSLRTYLHQGATWGPYGGVEHPRTDWRLAAERGGNAVLSVDPHLLIFVEGLQQYPDPSQPGGLDSYWWGGILGPARRFPVELSVPDQLVYSPHEYGPIKYTMPFFGPRMSYSSLEAVWQKHWAFLLAGRGGGTPIFIGEFGTCGGQAGCVQSSSPGSQGLWFQFLMRYLRSNTEIGWSYWALNGTNAVGHPQPNYVLKPDWNHLRLHQLTETLRDVEYAPSPA